MSPYSPSTCPFCPTSRPSQLTQPPQHTCCYYYLQLKPLMHSALPSHTPSRRPRCPTTCPRPLTPSLQHSPTRNVPHTSKHTPYPYYYLLLALIVRCLSPRHPQHLPTLSNIVSPTLTLILHPPTDKASHTSTPVPPHPQPLSTLSNIVSCLAELGFEDPALCDGVAAWTAARLATPRHGAQPHQLAALAVAFARAKYENRVSDWHRGCGRRGGGGKGKKVGVGQVR